MKMTVANALARRFAVALLVCLFFAGSSKAQDAVRPRITGISHVGYFVSDLPKAIAFWHDLLGYDESYDLKKPGSDRGPHRLHQDQ